jgi:hypothetical protein
MISAAGFVVADHFISKTKTSSTLRGLTTRRRPIIIET